MTIVGAIKSMASIIKLVLLEAEELRDIMIETKAEKQKRKLDQSVRRVIKALKEGDNDETIKNLHRDLNNIS